MIEWVIVERRGIVQINRVRVGVITLVVTGLVTIVVSSSSVDAAGRVSRRQGALPDAPGRDVVAKVCTSCHGADQLLDERNVTSWRETIELMKGFGATATDEEWKTIHSYIFENLASLNVNRGTADEFAGIFRLSEEAAKAVVAYREKAGGFKTIDDLKKAPGLDAARVDAVQKRLSFAS